MRSGVVLACLGLISGTAIAANDAAVLRVTSGTHLRVRLDQTLDTRHVHSGAPFLATLDRAVVEDGRVVIPRGTTFAGVVVESKRSGRFRGRAVLEVTLRSFRLHGRSYAVATVPDARVSESHKGRNLVLFGGGAVTGAGIGAIAGGGAGALIGAGAGAAAGGTAEFFTGRKHVRLPVETVLVFRLRGPIELRRV